MRELLKGGCSEPSASIHQMRLHDILLTFYLLVIREIWSRIQENQVGQNNNNRKKHK